MGEPDEELFLVGSDYIERSPIEFLMMAAGEEADRALIEADPFVRMAEENYLRRRRDQGPPGVRTSP